VERVAVPLVIALERDAGARTGAYEIAGARRLVATSHELTGGSAAPKDALGFASPHASGPSVILYISHELVDESFLIRGP
jgi:hypothetical protein